MSRLSRLLVATAMLLGVAAPGRADEFKPGYLQLTQIEGDLLRSILAF